MKKVTVKFGPANSVTLEFPAHYNVGQIINDPNVRGPLRVGENVRAVIDRVPQDNAAPVRDGDVIELETRASTKGS